MTYKPYEQGNTVRYLNRDGTAILLGVISRSTIASALLLASLDSLTRPYVGELEGAYLTRILSGVLPYRVARIIRASR